jgi:hypothetical protein
VIYCSTQPFNLTEGSIKWKIHWPSNLSDHQVRSEIQDEDEGDHNKDKGDRNEDVDGVRNDDLREKKQVEEEVYDITP